jgi:hypothetical protein
VRNGDWAARSAVLQAGLRELHPYLLGFQEVIRNAEHETASEILGSDYDVRHQTAGLLGDGSCAAIASRWPVAGWHEVDLQLTRCTADFPATTLIAEIGAPEPLLFVNHLPAWKPQLEPRARPSRRSRPHVHDAQPAHDDGHGRARGHQPPDRLRLHPLRRARPDAGRPPLRPHLRRAHRRRLGERPFGLVADLEPA